MIPGPKLLQCLCHFPAAVVSGSYGSGTLLHWEELIQSFWHFTAVWVVSRICNNPYHLGSKALSRTCCLIKTQSPGSKEWCGWSPGGVWAANTCEWTARIQSVSALQYFIMFSSTQCNSMCEGSGDAVVLIGLPMRISWGFSPVFSLGVDRIDHSTRGRA